MNTDSQRRLDANCRELSRTEFEFAAIRVNSRLIPRPSVFIRTTMMKLRASSTKISRRGLLPLPTTQEWGEDRGEGRFSGQPEKRLLSPTLHPMEEWEWLPSEPRCVHPCASVVDLFVLWRRLLRAGSLRQMCSRPHCQYVPPTRSSRSPKLVGLTNLASLCGERN